MDLNNIKDLEHYFANNFDTVLFPLIAEHYLLNDDLYRARKVCEIGLQHHPDSAIGYFISGRIQLAEGELKDAERSLKQTIKIDSGFYNAYVLLAEVQENLGRAQSTLRRLYTKILKMDSQNDRASNWLTEHKEEKKPVSVKEKHPEIVKPEPTNTPVFIPPEPETGKPKTELAGLKISPEIATFTLVAVLKSQKLYQQALEVLAVMSQKERVDTERITEEREELMNLLKEQQENR